MFLRIASLTFCHECLDGVQVFPIKDDDHVSALGLTETLHCVRSQVDFGQKQSNPPVESEVRVDSGAH